MSNFLKYLLSVYKCRYKKSANVNNPAEKQASGNMEKFLMKKCTFFCENSYKNI